VTVEVASTVLRRAGIRFVAVQQVTFAELIPGVVEGRWHLNTGMFITDARRRQLRYTRPIWAAPDGLIVRKADARRFTRIKTLASIPTHAWAWSSGRSKVTRHGRPVCQTSD
jgi:polar amino acid transport system substrate-binding protein